LKSFKVSAALLVLGSGLSWASHTACPSTPTALTALDSTPSLGCTSVNVIYSNFVTSSTSPAQIDGVTISTGALTAPPVLLGDISIVASTVYTGGMRLLTPLPTGVVCDQNYANGSYPDAAWCVQGANQLLRSTTTYTMTAASGTLDYVGLAGSIHVHSSGGGSDLGATGIIFREYCLGSADFSSGDCATQTKGSTYGLFRLGVVNGKNQDLVGAFSVATGGQTIIGIRDTVYFQTFNGNGSWVGLDYFDVITTPEPATGFGIGLGLTVIGLLARRKKRKI
jgi:hypothetical protein